MSDERENPKRKEKEIIAVFEGPGMQVSMQRCLESGKEKQRNKKENKCLCWAVRPFR